MDCRKLELEKTHRFAPFFLDYLAQDEKLKPFYSRFPTVNAVADQVNEKKSFPKKHRETLVEVLQEQYSALEAHKNVQDNISQLKAENCFTVTTGHQLNIFTGPLYFIYKIVTVINACKALKKKHPNYHFVPVYWMASEDHDYDEIKAFNLNGKKLSWETDQKGAVGKFDPSEIKKLFDQIAGLPDFFKKAYNEKSLADAVRHYVNHLFEEEGLVVVDADHHNLKALFKEVIKDDLVNNTAKELVENTSAKLDALGYKTQVFPREINFFYLQDNFRERIEKDNLKFKVLESDKSFSKEEMLEEIERSPESFSPNVVLRPVYQECILPNIAYVGGPAEVIYWLQLKDVFDHYKIPFPLVMPRNFAMAIPAHIERKREKIGLETEELFQPQHLVHKRIATKFAAHDVALNGQLNKIQELFGVIKKQAEEIDPTLGPHVEAQETKTRKRLEIIEKKFIRAEKKNQSDRIGQVDSVLETLFPNGGLQERSDNLLSFYIGNGNFIEDLKSCFDPFDFRFHILNYGK